MNSKKDENKIAAGDRQQEKLPRSEKGELFDITCELLEDARRNLPKDKTLKIPIDKLPEFGPAISSMIPEMRTVTQKTEIHTDGLWRLVNNQAGDVLKPAKDGSCWGAMKTAEGSSRMAKFRPAESFSVTSTTKVPVDPASFMMAAALYSIEKKLGDIEERVLISDEK